jgi:hypothetical protein
MSDNSIMRHWSCHSPSGPSEWIGKTTNFMGKKKVRDVHPQFNNETFELPLTLSLTEWGLKGFLIRCKNLSVVVLYKRWLSCSTSRMKNLDGWMMGRMDGKDNLTDRHLKYYIYR